QPLDSSGLSPFSSLDSVDHFEAHFEESVPVFASAASRSISVSCCSHQCMASSTRSRGSRPMNGPEAIEYLYLKITVSGAPGVGVGSARPDLLTRTTWLGEAVDWCHHE